MFNSVINGVGSFLPKRIITNHDLEELMNTSDEWIVQRTGIKQRHWVMPEESTSDLAYQACLNAVSHSSIKIEDIDLIILATLSPDHDFPGTGCYLQKKLGLQNVPTLDVRQQCTGFVYSLSIADSFIKVGKYENILVVGAEVHSKGLDKTTHGRDVSILFGDGAGAVVLSRGADLNNGIIDFDLHTDGKYTDELGMKAPGTGFNDPDRMSLAMFNKGFHYPNMNGKLVFVHAIKRMTESLSGLLDKNNLKIENVDLFLFHQANLRINTKVAEMLSIPENKVFNTIEKYGNTTAATIPIGMNDAIEAGVLRKGMTVAICAFGAGFTWGSLVLKY